MLRDALFQNHYHLQGAIGFLVLPDEALQISTSDGFSLLGVSYKLNPIQMWHNEKISRSIAIGCIAFVML
jgi:hypothetical protein